MSRHDNSLPRRSEAREPVAAVCLSGFGAALPAQVVTNHDLSQALDTSHEWIVSRTGITERRWAQTETTSSMATQAASHALADAQVDAAAIDLVVVATSTPDTPCPSTASRVAAELGITGGAFDINGACTGFIHALLSAAATMQTTGGHAALVIGADRFTSLIDPADRGTAILFGDGAAAVVLTRPIHRQDHSLVPGILAARLGGDPNGLSVLETPFGQPWVQMDGPELFRRAVRALVDSGQQVLRDAKASADRVDLYIPHQANSRIVAAAANRLNIPTDRVVFDMAERANTSAASIPLALHDAVTANRIRPGQEMLLSGVGAGLAWGSIYLRWERS